jgi:P27 family predicted phage terminase small subunit
MYLKLTNDIMKDSSLLQDVKVLNNQDKLFKQCRSSAMDLGLTISSRCKLVVPKAEEDTKELSLEDRLFGL